MYHDIFKVTRANCAKVIKKRGRPPKCVLGATESQKDEEEDQNRPKRMRVQQKASISSLTSSLDPFDELNKMPGITPESPKKDHCDLKPRVSTKSKKKVARTILASPAILPSIKTKVHHYHHHPMLLLLTPE